MEASLSTTYNAQAIVNAGETTLKLSANFALLNGRASIGENQGYSD